MPEFLIALEVWCCNRTQNYQTLASTQGVLDMMRSHPPPTRSLIHRPWLLGGGETAHYCVVCVLSSFTLVL